MAGETFDVEAALKDHPEAEVAEYLAKEHGIDRDAYLKDGKTDAEFIREISSAPLPSSEAAPASEEQAQKTSGVYPALGGGAGAVLGSGMSLGSAALNKVRNTIASALPTQAPAAPAGPRFAPPAEVSARSMRGATVPPALTENPLMFGSTSDVYNWAQGKQAESGQYAKGFLGGHNMEHEAQLQKLRAQIEAHDPLMTVLPGTNGMIGPKAEADRIRSEAGSLKTTREAQITAAQAANERRAAEAAMLRAARLRAQEELLKKQALGGLPLKAANRVGSFGPVAGGLIGYNAVDTLQDFSSGNPKDIPRGVLSGMGTLGALAQKAPKYIPPKYRALGLGTALAAPVMNRWSEWMDSRAEGGHIDHFADGGEVQHFASGSAVLSRLAKLLSQHEVPHTPGYLASTAKNPNPLVGTRYQIHDLGGLAQPKETSLDDMLDARIITTPWDSTHRNKQILSVSGRPLTTPVVTHGGDEYLLDLEHQAQQIGGASNRDIAKRVQGRANIAAKEPGSGRVIMLPSTMGGGAENFAVPTFQVYYDLLKQAEHSPARLEEMTNQLRAMPKVNKKTGAVTYPYSTLKDLSDPDVLKQFIHGIDLSGSAGDLRKAFINQQASKKLQQSLGSMGVSPEDVSAALINPKLAGRPAATVGHAAVEMRPGAELMPSKNISYDTNWAGDYLGHLGDYSNTPTQVLMRDPYRDIFAEMRQKYPDKPFSSIDKMSIGALEKRNEGISQLVDEPLLARVRAYHEGLAQDKFPAGNVEEALKFLSATGHKEGGKIDADTMKTLFE